MYLMLVRPWTEELRITFSGAPSEHIGCGRAKFWFFPEAAGAQGELYGGPFDCAGVSLDSSVLPSTLKVFFLHPVSGLVHDRLRCSFDALVEDLEGPEYLAQLVAEGWVLRLLAHVAQASREPRLSNPKGVGGLAPWQLRRAIALLRADLAENQSLKRVAAACRLSTTHFGRAFKQSMGVPPHQWLTNARLDMARELLLRSALPLAQIASTCGFADQSHFCRIFRRSEGVSPGVWRRQHH
jgi:AraC-like DNA-binding protein